jgi:hypothetical protein
MARYNYDAQIAYLKEHPEEIKHDWLAAKGLFKYIAPLREGKSYFSGSGCLTMIKSSNALYLAFSGTPDNPIIDKELTEAIAEDERIPKDGKGITVDNLEVFKEWQEKIDEIHELAILAEEAQRV